MNFSCKAGRSADTPDDFKDIEIPKVQKKKAGDPLLDRSDYIWKMSLKNTGIDSRPIKQEEREKVLHCFSLKHHVILVLFV